ncbi:MAG: hypothetical protein ACP5HM_09885 [Anaerolineae bacterium]
MLLRVIATAVAVLSTLTVLAGTFWPVSPLREIRALLLQWAMVLAAFAFTLAFLNLLRANVQRLRRKGRGRIPSLIIVLSALGTAGVLLWEFFTVGRGGPWSLNLMRVILIPGESALLALTSVTLLTAGLRMLRTRRTVSSLLFVLVVMLILVKALPYVGPLGAVAEWVEGVLATAGMRGLLLGVALGTVIAGLRAAFVTRPYVDE